MTEISERAPAKINLYLHITGRRADGYHDLDSLTVFADIGDEVRVWPSPHFSFVVEGPQAAGLATDDHAGNLVVAAARSLAELAGHGLDVAFALTKNLPVASGVGGGSSDAAAALRALARHWGLDAGDVRLMRAAAKHGQDVPVCVKIENCYITADGVAPAPLLPRAGIVLVNPGRGLATPLVYKEYREGGEAFSPPARLAAAPADLNALVGELKKRGNDLYAPACRLMPDIAGIVAALEATEGCLLARMSGSGATCFGLYANRAAARNAAALLREARPGWWVEAGETL